MKSFSRRIVAICLALVMVLMLTACSDSEKAKDNNKSASTINVYICANYVSEEGNVAVATKLQERLSNETTVNITCISTSSEDPSMQMASIMKLTTSIAAGEVDLIIADEDNAARNARGEAFCALSDVLDDDQITALGDRALSYFMVDEDGNPTEETTAICGIDITGIGLTDGAVSASIEQGIFVAGNAPNMEACKELMKSIAHSVQAV